MQNEDLITDPASKENHLQTPETKSKIGKMDNSFDQSLNARDTPVKETSPLM